MIEEIKEEFKKVPNKAELYRQLGKEFNIFPDSVKRNWFMRGEYPKNYQEKILEIIKEQNKK